MNQNAGRFQASHLLIRQVPTSLALLYEVPRKTINKWCLASLISASLAVLVMLAMIAQANAALISARSPSSQGRASAAAGAFTINKPTGTTVGDVMVASIGYRPCSSKSGGGCTTSITPPAGWTLIRLVEQKTGGGTGGYGLRLGIFYRVVTAADAAVTNYTWTIGGAPVHNGAAGVLSSFMNVDTTNPIVIEAGQATSSSRSHTTPNIGPLATNTLLVSTHAALSSATWTPPAGMTEILDWKSEANISDLGMSLEINNEQRAAPGLVGTRTATFSSPPAVDAGATHILALRPIQADPTISMARSGNLIVGATASYALTIGNNGPNPISASNITVTNTLPTGLTYASRSGTGWTCNSAGQVVTCTYSGSALTKNGTLPVLTLNVNVVSGTVWTNTATVSSGADGDNNLIDSTATDTWPTNTTTLATGTDPSAATVAPSALATDVNTFTLRTNTGTEPINSVTVNLSSPLGIDTLAITDNTNNVLGSVAFPAASGAITIPVIGMTATTTLQTFKVRVTPLVHVSMPAPPGATYTITAPVTAWSGSAGHTGSDTNTNALTIDNLSPNSATATDATRNGAKFNLKWTSSSSSDFSTTDGSVVYRWAASSAGSEVPIEGSSPTKGDVNGTATVACVVSSSASTALALTDGPSGSSSCTTSSLTPSQSFTYKVFQKDTRGNFDIGVLLAGISTPPPSPPASFNCVEVGADASSGPLFTKLVDTPFSFDIVALKADGSVETTYATDASKNVTVELVDGSGTTACASRTARVTWSGQTFASGNAGRITASAASVANAYGDLRCRVSDGSVTGCSADNFAIRPTGFTLTASANADATGSDANATPIVKTGAGFTLTASAVAGYNGTPALDSSKAAAHSGANQTGTLAGNFGMADTGGVATGNFTYSEVGYFRLATNGVTDNSFTDVDADNGDCTDDYSNTAVSGKYGCHFGNTAATDYFGRFVPDHFEVTVAAHGGLQNACLTSFTYTGQPIAYATIPSLSIKAMNASTPPTVTKNYVGSFQKLTASGISIALPTTDSTQNGKDGSTKTALTASMSSGTLTNTLGSLTYSLSPDDRYTYVRNANSLVGPYDSDIPLIVTAVGDGETSASGALPTLSPSGVPLRFGRLRLSNAVGSELLALPVPLTAQYWNGFAFVKNSADTCTNISAENLGFTFPSGSVAKPNNLAACETELTIAGSAPDYRLNLSAPGDSNIGWADLTLNLAGPPSGVQCLAVGSAGDAADLAGLPWLQYNWDGVDQASDGNLFDDNPRARATFGKRKGSDKVIIRREIY
jgi:uncharacterized repeat protein (TIGR01451 family)